MIEKTNKDEFLDFLVDASNFKGDAEKLYIPESEKDISSILTSCNLTGEKITVAGNGTGVTGSRVPLSGSILSLQKLNNIIMFNEKEKWIRVQPALVLSELQNFVESKSLFYPPDPTERNCFIGGNVATNASGAKSFKYGATRNYVIGLNVILPCGEILSISRGEFIADGNSLRFSTETNSYSLELPNVQMPTVKNASGYFIKSGMDLIDLFIGSEGTLGIITEIKLKLIALPKELLSVIVFFDDENDGLNFIDEARSASRNSENSESELSARGLEFFDGNSLKFLSNEFNNIPDEAGCAVWFEQENFTDELLGKWLDLIIKHNADAEKAWIAANAVDLEKFKDFRHSISWKVNEYITRHNFRKVGTDTSVPVNSFRDYFNFMKALPQRENIDYVIYGHFGDCHPHLNMLPKNNDEFAKAKNIYTEICKKAVKLGGTVSAEHGIGKAKRDYLTMMYGEKTIKEMAKVKLYFDPKNILSPGNLFNEELIDELKSNL
jgi:D-lactate dehydrogenase (cytochrome)